MKSRANDRLRALGIYDSEKRSFSYDPQDSIKVSEWFDPLAKGAISHDLFAQSKEGSGYVAKPSQDWKSVNLSTLDLVIA